VPATTIVSTRSHPGITFAIFTAASVTVDMIMILKKQPEIHSAESTHECG
jgi:hypothetical protein